MANAAARVGDVAGHPRDDVHVQVRDGLPRRGADVDADVEAVGRVGADDGFARGDGGLHQLGALGGRGLEPGCDVPPRRQQRVTGVHGERVPEADDERARVEHAVDADGAERAGASRHRVPTAVADRRRMVSVPSRPAATQAAHRHRGTGRFAVRDV